MADKDDKKADKAAEKTKDVKVEEKKPEKPMEETKDVKVEEKKPEEAGAPSAPKGDTGGGVDQYGRQLFEVTCSACGNKAQVPFKPASDRPVYCRDCYMKQRGGSRGPRR